MPVEKMKTIDLTLIDIFLLMTGLVKELLGRNSPFLCSFISMDRRSDFQRVSLISQTITVVYGYDDRYWPM